MPETNDSTNPVSEAAAARDKFEQEKMSRRAALRKIGLTSGMALFGMFAVDDFARLALRGLQQHKETQAVAETVAQELRSSGVAFAADGSDDYYDGTCTAAQYNCTGGTRRKHKNKNACYACVSTKSKCLDDSDADQAICLSTAGSDQAKRDNCLGFYTGVSAGCRDSFVHCCHDNNCNCGV